MVAKTKVSKAAAAAARVKKERKSSAARRAEQLKFAETAFLLETTQLVGAQYSGTLEVLRLLEIGEELELVREPENEHDKKAIRFGLNGLKLGYVAREHNDLASRLLDADVDVRAFVVGKKDNARFPQEMVRVGLYLQTV